jgi:hypothetical protein
VAWICCGTLSTTRGWHLHLRKGKRAICWGCFRLLIWHKTCRYALWFQSKPSHGALCLCRGVADLIHCRAHHLRNRPVPWLLETSDSDLETQSRTCIIWWAPPQIKSLEKAGCAFISNLMVVSLAQDRSTCGRAIAALHTRFATGLKTFAPEAYASLHFPPDELHVPD